MTLYNRIISLTLAGVLVACAAVTRFFYTPLTTPIPRYSDRVTVIIRDLNHNNRNDLIGFSLREGPFLPAFSLYTGRNDDTHTTRKPIGVAYRIGRRIYSFSLDEGFKTYQQPLKYRQSFH